MREEDRPPLERTLQILRDYPDRDQVIPVFGSALEEPDLVSEAAELLLNGSETRAPRELLRRYHRLPAPVRRRVREEQPQRSLRAARQLLRSNRVQTRRNIALFAADLLEDKPGSRDSYPLLLMLLDDPRHEVRDLARETFLRDLETGRATDGLHQQPSLALGPRDPILNGLQILLRRFPQHEDRNVIRALFRAGEPGADLLARAVGEEWDGAHVILEVARELETGESILRPRVDGLFRWLRSPFPRTREGARRILRERSDAAFLRCAVARLESEESELRDREYPIYRYLRWDRLPLGDLQRLRPETLLRLAGYIQAAATTTTEKVARIGRLLPATRGPIRHQLLALLQGSPTESILGELAELLTDPDEETQRLALELIPSSGSVRAYILVVQKLSSPFESVRATAQRKISGHSLRFLFSAFDLLTPTQRREILPILRKVDLHFVGQLRRALRAPDEGTVIKALRTVEDLDDLSAVEDGIFDLTVSPSSRVRATLTRALGRTEPEAALHYLRLFLADPDGRVAANAIEALDDLDRPAVRAWLEELRDHPYPRARTNALLALAQRGDSGALVELRHDAQDSTSPSRRASAAWALAKLEEGL